jgi:hypothetical protein
MRTGGAFFVVEDSVIQKIRPVFLYASSKVKPHVNLDLKERNRQPTSVHPKTVVFNTVYSPLDHVEPIVAGKHVPILQNRLESFPPGSGEAFHFCSYDLRDQVPS